MHNIQKNIRKGATLPIVIYQKTLSLDHGPLKAFYPHGYCQFHPTCSEYCRQAIIKRGIIKGIFSGGWRILRCHPWSQGGVDQVK
ncbi:MAG: membrane protein insertion efficiency factor YidD [Patescibacteria group bacterium]